MVVDNVIIILPCAMPLQLANARLPAIENQKVIRDLVRALDKQMLLDMNARIIPGF
jgi:hypothetical protein